MDYPPFLLSWLYWNPSREIFQIPLIDHPVAWYGFFFALGFVVAYFIMRRLLLEFLLSHSPQKDLLTLKQQAVSLCDQLTSYVVIGTIVGARLGHVIFYALPYYLEHPLEIFKVWEGGLASHGGAVGIIIALILFRFRIKERFPNLSVLALLDRIVIPTAFVGVCIRLGNFFNQEILGIETNLPWGIIFGHPLDGGAIVPRHPVTLYEAFFYLLIFIALSTAWLKNKGRNRVGLYTGWFFVLIFSTRFILEWWKLPQGDLELPFLSMGQYLSLPFILAGFYLIYRALKHTEQLKVVS